MKGLNFYLSKYIRIITFFEYNNNHVYLHIKYIHIYKKTFVFSQRNEYIYYSDKNRVL